MANPIVGLYLRRVGPKTDDADATTGVDNDIRAIGNDIGPVSNGIRPIGNDVRPIPSNVTEKDVSDTKVNMTPEVNNHVTTSHPMPNGVYINEAFEEVDLDTTTHSKSPGHVQSVEKAADAVHHGDQQQEGGCCFRNMARIQEVLEGFLQKYGTHIKYAIGMLAILGYAAYFGYAMWWSLEGEDQIRLLWMTCLAVVLCLISIFRRTVGDSCHDKVIVPINQFVIKHFVLFKWGLILAFGIFVIVFIVVDVAIKRPRNLVSLSGYVVFILGLFLLSSNPSKVRWRPVVWGLGIQFVFALLTLRTPWGLAAFQWLGERVSEFLVHTDAGSKFVFGDSYEDHRFAFKVLPVVVFFSAVISTLYYLGVMQLVIMKLAWVMSRVLGTTAGESVNAAGNIFIGQTEAPLLIRPLIEDMSPSELHAVMTGGYATIAGSVMASFIMFGVKANHLITASVMAAPCALALSKLSYPETREPSEKKEVQLEKPPQRNVIEAVSAGASAAISLVANIAANLIAFIALLAFINATLQWFGARIGLTPPDYPPLTFQFICSYVMWPFSFLMGVDISDCRKVGELIGFKVFINEFVAYTELGKLIANRKVLEGFTGTWKWVNGDILLDNGKTLVGGFISMRSEVICTYALCGFANLASIGMVMGALGSMSETQRPVVARLAFRAMVVGTLVCFTNACTAGLLYQGS